MQIYIYKNNQQAGPFADSAIQNWLRNGQLSVEDFACRRGDAGWQPLKILFPALTQLVSKPAVSVSSPNGNGTHNQQVTEWAQKNLSKPVEVQLRYKLMFSKILVVFGYVVLAVALLWLPCVFLFGAAYNFLTKGWSDTVAGGLVFGIVLTVFLGGLFLAVVFLPLLTRRKIAATLSAEGVETRGGQKYAWQDLNFLEYKKENTRVHGNLAASLTKAALFAGVKKVSVELVFANGKAVIPPLISNQPEILGLLETIPAPWRGEQILRR